MGGGKNLSSEDVIGTLSAALIERYGEEALAVAVCQADLADGLPRETWKAIIARVGAEQRTHPDAALPDAEPHRTPAPDG